MWVDTPWGTLLLKCDTLRALEEVFSHANGTLYPPNLQNAISPKVLVLDCFQILYRGEVSETT